MIVEICPVRCRWTGTGIGVVSPTVSSTGAPVGRNGRPPRDQRAADGPGGGAGGGGQAGVVFHRHLQERRFDLADVFLADLIGPGAQRRAHLLDEFLQRKLHFHVLGLASPAGQRFPGNVGR